MVFEKVADQRRYSFDLETADAPSRHQEDSAYILKTQRGLVVVFRQFFVLLVVDVSEEKRYTGA